MIGNVILHAAFVLTKIVKGKFVETVISVTGLIMIKFELKAKVIVTLSSDGRKGGITLGAKSHILEALAIDYHITNHICLFGGMLNHVTPVTVLYLHIDGMNIAVVKYFICILCADSGKNIIINRIGDGLFIFIGSDQ